MLLGSAIEAYGWFSGTLCLIVLPGRDKWEVNWARVNSGVAFVGIGRSMTCYGECCMMTFVNIHFFVFILGLAATAQPRQQSMQIKKRFWKMVSQWKCGPAVLLSRDSGQRRLSHLATKD